MRGQERLINNCAEGLARILEETAGGNSWPTILLRLPGASRCGPVHFSGIGSTRAVGLPLGTLEAGER